MRLTRITNANRQRSTTGRAYVRVVDGPGAGTEISLPAVGVVIGADPTVDLVLQDDAVSGRHCSVVPGEGGFHVKDFGSRNGTLLDGVALTEADVPIGSILRVGRTLLQLMPAEEGPEIPPSARDHFGQLRGTSLAMRRIYAVLERASQSDAPVLVLGESGTGKELTARAIHEHSPRSSGPFVVFDCGAASENLIESALFGHLKGAFTGAQSDRPGAFAAAHGGTLFLDEIGDLPLALQPKLLRMLEAGEVTPLGTHKPERYDVRVVAATHRSLFDDVREGRFRGDLYYRLAVVEVQMPPFRQRLEDLESLVRLFLARAGAASDQSLAGANFDRLRNYHWPGNIRELRNVISRAVALSLPGSSFVEMPILLRSDRASGSDRPLVIADRNYHDAKADLLNRFELEYLQDLMRRHGSNLSEAARVAGVERKYLYTLLERHGLRPKKD